MSSKVSAMESILKDLEGFAFLQVKMGVHFKKFYANQIFFTAETGANPICGLPERFYL
jgi:hypothetical protein